MHPIYRRTVLAVLAGSLALPAFAAWAPKQPIKLVVTTAPGTGSDTIARLIAPGMQEALGQSVVVDNRPGAGGALGMEQVARAPADGYTIVLGANGTMVAGPLLNPAVKYRPEKDFAPIAGITRTAFVIVVANSPTAPKNIAELLARTKAAPASYGSSGVGTVTHLSSELFLFRTGAKATHIPYKGSNQSLTDLIGGQVLFVSDTLPAVLPLIRGGKLRAIAVTAPQRSTSLPDVPTLVESGYPGLVAEGWWGLAAPAKTPPDVIKALSDAAMKALQTPDAQARIKGLEMEVMGMSPDAFAAFMKTETPMWADLIQKANLKAE